MIKSHDLQAAESEKNPIAPKEETGETMKNEKGFGKLNGEGGK